MPIRHHAEGIHPTLIDVATVKMFFFYSPVDGAIVEAYFKSETAPSGGDLVFDININTTTIFTDQTQRPKITAGSNEVTKSGLSATVTRGALVSVDLDTVPSALGSNLVFVIVIEERQSRKVVNYSTGSLANNATANLNLDIGKMFVLFRSVVSDAAWVRAYGTSAARTADASRLITDAPVGEHGCFLDIYHALPGELDWNIDPPQIGADQQTTPTGTISIAVTNKSGSTATITGSLYVTEIEL